uniref:DnaJ family protein n=1 Tax=Euglena gracilis TaxID=3039 RepID=S5RFD0_EUGGR|nr:DnaJ family protein [Euglena gracilis]
MGKEYYDILGLDRNARDSEIKAAYKQAAYRWHPDRHPENNKPLAEKKFKEIAEAYEVLSDPQRRAAFDRYGDVHHGAEASSFEDSLFTDPNQLFRHFFGGINFTSSTFGFQTPSGSNPKVPMKDHPKVINLKCSLTELFSGCQKRWKITKLLTDSTGRSMQVEKILQIDIQPGWKQGTKVVFENEGDESPDRLPADYVFVVEEVPHESFTREGNDLRYRHKISLSQALSGFEMELKQLDGRMLMVKVAEVVSHKTQTIIPGEGMPHKSGRGNLLIQFDVGFPTRLRAKEEVQFLRD